MVKNHILPLENKIHIFAPPCNILYFCLQTKVQILFDSQTVIMVQKRKPAKFYGSRYSLTWFAVQGVNILFKCKEDHRSYRRNFCSYEKKAPKKFRLVRDLNPSPQRHRCSALTNSANKPTESWSFSRFVINLNTSGLLAQLAC